MASCGGDGIIKILDTNEFSTLVAIRAHQEWVDDIKFSEDTLNFFSIGRDEEVKVWRTQDYSCLYHYSLNAFGKCPFSESGGLIATFENKKSLGINNTTDGKPICKILLNTNSISSTCFSKEEKFFATAHKDSTIKIWSPWSGDLLCTLVSDFTNISAMNISPSQEMIAAGSTEGQINIWLTGDQRKIIINQISNYKITALQFSPNNQFLFIGDLRGDIFTIDISNNKKVFEDSRHGSGITLIKLCLALNQFAVGSLDGSLSIYNIENKISIPVLKKQNKPDLLSEAKLNELLEKSDSTKKSSKEPFKVVNKSSTSLTIKMPIITPKEIVTNKDSDDSPLNNPSFNDPTKIREWKIGDAVDEMLNVFGYAKGGMGAVYFVRHRNWQVKLAMKSPLPEHVNDAFIMQRFIREATTWISLGVHPNIASCYFVKNIEGIPRIFIEYIENGSLYDWIYKGKVNTLEIVLKFAIQFCNGMEYSHRRGVIHRDIKPSNCLISSENNLKITDFGLVKMAQFHEEPIHRNIESLRKKIKKDITTDNSAMGTPEYMSPEQWESSNEVGPESDIYSFGIMLFEMVCSRKPFMKTEEDGMFKMLQLHSLAEPPNPTNYLKSFPPALKKIILKCLQKNISSRYQNFNDILFDLKKLYLQEIKTEFPDDKNTSTHINPETKNNYSISLLELGFSNEADEMLAKAKMAYEDNFPITFNYYLRQWKFHQLTDIKLGLFLKEKVDESIENIQALQSYCILLLYRGEYQYCSELIYKYKEFKNSSFLLNLLAISLLMMDENEEGMRYFNLAAQVAPPGPEILLTYSSVFFFKDNKKTSKELFINVTNKYPQTYKVNDPHGFRSEFQIMKALLISHYPGLPIIPIHILPFSLKNESKNKPVITRKLQFILTITDKDSLLMWDFKDQSERVHLLPIKNITLYLHLNYKNILAIVSEKTVFTYHWQDDKLEPLLIVQKKILFMGISAKDSFIYTIEEDNTLTILNLKNNEKKSILYQNKINCAAISFQENYIALGFDDGTIKILISSSLQEFLSMKQTDNITAITFLEEGRLITGHTDNQLLLWDILMGVSSESFVSPHDNCIEIIPNLKENPMNAEKFVTRHKNGNLVFWKRKEKRCLISFQKAGKHFNICPFNQHYSFINEANEIEYGYVHYPEMPLLQYIYCKPSINLGTVIPEKEFEVLLAEGQENIQLGMFPDAYISIKEALTISGFEKSYKALDLLYAISNKGEVKSISDVWYQYHIPEKLYQNTQMKFLNDSDLVVLPCQNKFLIWDLISKETKEIKCSLPENFIKMKWLNSNQPFTFILLNKDRMLMVFNAESNSHQLLNIETRGNIIDFCIFENNCCMLDNTGQFTVFNMQTKNILFKEEFGKTAKQIYEYPPGKNILIVHENFIQIFSLELRTTQRNFKGSKAPIKNIAFSSQGRFISQTNIDGNTCVWNAFTAKAVSNLPFDTGITVMQFSPNSNYLAIGDANCNLSIIDINSDSIVYRFKNLNNSIASIVFSPNSRYVLVASYQDPKIAVLEFNWDIQFSHISHQNFR